MFYATQEFVNHLRKEELKYTLHEAEDPESGKDRVIVKFGARISAILSFSFSSPMTVRMPLSAFLTLSRCRK